MYNEYQKYVILDQFQDIPKESWHDLLEHSIFANIFHSPNIMQLWQACPAVEPFIFAVLDKQGVLKGLLEGISLQDGNRIKGYYSHRAICVGGPLLHDEISKDELAALLTAVLKYLKKKGAIYFEIRNLNNYNRFNDIFYQVGFSYKPHLNFHVDCTDRSLLEKRISPSKLRQVRKSLKEGAKVIEASDTNQIHDFYLILERLYKLRIHTPLFPESFFLSFFNLQVGKFFLVSYHEQIIGGIMCPILDNRVIYEWFVCGEDEHYKHLYPSVLATWAAIEYASKNGIKRFDFMGAGSPNKDYGVREFKARFGGELVEHGRFLYVFKPFLFKLGSMAIFVKKRLTRTKL